MFMSLLCVRLLNHLISVPKLPKFATRRYFLHSVFKYATKFTKNISGCEIVIFAYYDLTLGAGVVVMWKLHKSWYSCKLAHLYGFLVVTLWSEEVFGAIDVGTSEIIFETMGELVMVEDSVVPKKYINQIVLFWRWQKILFS